MTFWFCTVPLIIVFGVLMALRTKWNSTLITIIPALLMGTLSGIMAWWAIWEGEGAVYCDTPFCAAGLMFFSVFGVWFMATGLVVILTRFVASRVRPRGTLSDPDKPRD
jgi:hypothetical protein